MSTRTGNRLLAAAVTMALVALPVAAEAKTKPPTPFANDKIEIQKSIGGIALGDTIAEVNHTLHRKFCSASGTCYYSAPGNTYSVSVILAAKTRNGTPHVVRVTLDAGTTKNAATVLRTNRGVGLGSTLKQLKKAYPHAKSNKYGVYFGDPSNKGTSFAVDHGHVIEVFMQSEHIG